MRKYSVELEVKVTYNATVEIEAKNEEEASSKAEQQLSEFTPEDLMSGKYKLPQKSELAEIDSDYSQVCWETQSVEEMDDEDGSLAA